jgi:hypothetical protein
MHSKPPASPIERCGSSSLAILMDIETAFARRILFGGCPGCLRFS